MVRSPGWRAGPLPGPRMRPRDAGSRPPAVPSHLRLALGRRRAPQRLWPHQRPSRGRPAETDSRRCASTRAGATRVPFGRPRGTRAPREVVAAVVPSRATTTTATDGSPAGRCAGNGIAPVRRSHPAYPYMRDGDGDGIVCDCHKRRRRSGRLPSLRFNDEFRHHGPRQRPHPRGTRCGARYTRHPRLRAACSLSGHPGIATPETDMRSRSRSSPVTS